MFRIAIPPRLGLAFEFAVGIVLIVLGLANLVSRAELRRQGTARPVVVGMVQASQDRLRSRYWYSPPFATCLGDRLSAAVRTRNDRRDDSGDHGHRSARSLCDDTRNLIAPIPRAGLRRRERDFGGT